MNEGQMEIMLSDSTEASDPIIFLNVVNRNSYCEVGGQIQVSTDKQMF